MFRLKSGHQSSYGSTSNLRLSNFVHNSRFHFSDLAWKGAKQHTAYFSDTLEEHLRNLHPISSWLSKAWWSWSEYQFSKWFAFGLSIIWWCLSLFHVFPCSFIVLASVAPILTKIVVWIWSLFALCERKSTFLVKSHHFSFVLML
jgi:hypothetical protein